MPIGIVRSAIIGIKKGIQGILIGPTEITTSTAATATAYSNQRKLDRTSNGVLWATYYSSSPAYNRQIGLTYSSDNGSTWTDVTGSEGLGWTGGGTSYTPNWSFFIDQDDYAHLAYKDRSDGYIYYRRGTPNAGRTAWTWSGAQIISGNTNSDYPDIVAHREGTGWKAHVVWSLASFGAYYETVTITSGGVVSVGGDVSLAASQQTSTYAYPSIDFNHTGDGKTVAGGTPHLYVAWSAGTTGAGKGIRFKKATYSGGSWTWGTEREIDSTLYVSDAWYHLACMFDGTRVIVAGGLAPVGQKLRIYERDAADTTTVVRSLLDTTNAAEYLFYGSSTYDGVGNVYLFGQNQDEASGSRDFVYRKWTRATNTLGPEVVVDANVENTWASAKRGYSNNRIEFIYTDGTASPYSIKYGGIT